MIRFDRDQQSQRMRRQRASVGLRLRRKFRLKLLVLQWRNDHEDDQEDQQDIDQRGYVDERRRSIFIVCPGAHRAFSSSIPNGSRNGAKDAKAALKSSAVIHTRAHSSSPLRFLCVLVPCARVIVLTFNPTSTLDKAEFEKFPI